MSALRMPHPAAVVSRPAAGGRVLILLGILSGCGFGPEPELVFIPGGSVRLGSRVVSVDNPPRTVRIDPFLLGAREVTVAEYARFLNATVVSASNAPHPDMIQNNGQWRPARGRGRWPVAHVTRADAESYCRWISAEIGRSARLPTEDEWEAAARGGIVGARWPWGHGAPEGRMAFNLPERIPAGRHEPNAYGLHDMAGNVFEWCAGSDARGVPARGGAWSETSAEECAVFRRHFFRIDYRDADTGFRIAVDP